MSTPSLGSGGGSTRSVQVVLGADAGPGIRALGRFGAAATEAGKKAEKAALQAAAAQDKQAKASADAARITQTAAAKAAQAQLEAAKATAAHARAVAAGAEKEIAATKLAAQIARAAAQEQAAAARLVRAEQQRAAAAATAAARQQAAASRSAAAAARQAAAQQTALDRQHAAALTENARRQAAATRAQQAAARQAATQQAAYDRAHAAAIAENTRRQIAAQRAAQAAAAAAARQQAAFDRTHAAAIAENARRTAAAQRAATAQAAAAARAQATAQRQAAAAAAAAARAQERAAAQALAAQRRLGAAQARDIQRQRALDQAHQDALDENARREEDRNRRAQSAQKKVGGGLVAGGAVVAVGVLASIAAAARLEQAMSRVQAATRASAEEMASLQAAAISAGERTQYSSVEAAQGIEQLAKAGISTTDILGGGLDAALSLAASDSIAVGDAAEYMASALTQFGLSGDQATAVADKLASVAGEAQGGVADAALALEYVGTVAAQEKVSINETAGALGLLASNGIVAEKAGTGLRGTILALTSPSNKAAAEMEHLGLNLYDAEGNFVGIRGAAEQLQVALGSATQQQRDYAMGVIFGNAQMVAANVLLKSGAEGVDAWTDKVNEQGRASEMAAARTDNLIGDVERLGGALNSALVSTGDSGLNPLRGLTQELTNVVSGYNELSDGSKTAALATGAVTSAIALASGGFLLLAPRIVATRAAMAALAATSPRAARGVGLATTAIKGAVLAGAALAAIDIGTSFFGINSDDMARWANELEQTAGPSTQDKIAALREEIEKLNDAAHAGPETDLGFTTIHWTDWSGKASDAADKVDTLKKRLADLESQQRIEQAQAGRSADGADTLGTAMQEAASDADDERTAVERLSDALDLLNGGSISVTESQIAFRTAQREGEAALKKTAKAAKDHAISLNANSKAGGENLDTILGQIKAAEDYAKAVTEQAQATTDDVTAQNRGRKAYKTRIDDLRATWKEAGLTAAQIDYLIGKYAQIPEKAKTEVTAPNALNAARQAGKVRDDVISIPERWATGIFARDSASPVLRDVQERIRVLAAQPHIIQVAVRLTGATDLGAVGRSLARAGRADGGPIPGPFIGPKADNVLIAATPGEYMQQHAAVQHYGLSAMDAINQRRVPKQLLQGYATGGPIVSAYAGGGRVSAQDRRYGQAGGQYAVATGANTAPAEIARAAHELGRLAQAWRDANEAADKAGERAKLVSEEAATARALAKANAKERGDAAKAHREAVKALHDFDVEAKRTRQEAALARKEEQANNRAEYEFGKLTQAQQLASLEQRMKGEQRYSDAWMTLARQRDDILAAQAEAAAKARDNQASWEFDHSTTEAQLADVDRRLAAETRYSDTWMDLARQREQLQDSLSQRAEEADARRQQGIDDAAARLNQLLDERDGILGQLADAQHTYDDAVKQANAGLAEQTAQIVASRREALAAFDLTQRASAGTSVSVATLLKNAAGQVETFTAFMEQLDSARARGVSQDVIKSLDLERGPEALAQLRKLNAASAEEVARLNQLVGQRLTLAGNRAQAEADSGAGQIGADVAQASAEADAAITAAGADLLTSQQQLGAELVAVGTDNARDYWSAIGQGLTAGIPAVATAAAALRDAVTSPLAAAVTVTPIPGHAGGGMVTGPYVGPRADNVVRRVTPGEFITNVAATRKHRPLLEAINADRMPGYADGGYVAASRIGGGGWGGRVTADVNTYDLQMEVRAVVRRLDTLTDTVRDGRRDKSIVGSPASW